MNISNKPKIVTDSAIIDCNFGVNCKVFNSSNLYGCKLGKNCFVGPWVEIQNDVIIGDNVRIQSHSLICEGMKIGDNCFIGHSVMTANSRYPISGKDDWLCEPPIIGSNTNIGSNVTILPGIVIGDNVTIGAGSVINKNIPSNCTVYSKNILICIEND